jgi:predicted transcriptional regulator
MKTAIEWEEESYLCSKYENAKSRIEWLAEKCSELEQQNSELLAALEELMEDYCNECRNLLDETLQVGVCRGREECMDLYKYKQLIAQAKGGGE